MSRDKQSKQKKKRKREESVEVGVGMGGDQSSHEVSLAGQDLRISDHHDHNFQPKPPCDCSSIAMAVSKVSM